MSGRFQKVYFYKELDKLEKGFQPKLEFSLILKGSDSGSIFFNRLSFL